MADLTQREVDAIYALRHAADWIGSAPHGDNCFVSDHYPGDPGNRCNCGKDSAEQAVQNALTGYPEAMDDDGEPLEVAPAAPKDAQPGGEVAPPNSLPTWDECAMRVGNSDFITKRVAEGGYGAEPDSLLATELHRFIYEYDDADPYRSGWFLHRLERLLNEARAASPSQPQPDAARVLAEFAQTAPGRLPQRVQDAIAVVLSASPQPQTGTHPRLTPCKHCGAKQGEEHSVTCPYGVKGTS